MPLTSVTHFRIRTHTHTHTHTHTNTQTHKRTNTQTHKHTNTQTHTHTHKHTPHTLVQGGGRADDCNGARGPAGGGTSGRRGEETQVSRCPVCLVNCMPLLSTVDCVLLLLYRVLCTVSQRRRGVERHVLFSPSFLTQPAQGWIHSLLPLVLFFSHGATHMRRLNATLFFLSPTSFLSQHNAQGGG